MSRRRKQTANSASTVQGTYLIYGVVVVVAVFVVLAIARYYPSPADSLSDALTDSAQPSIVLPQSAADVSPEAMRQEAQEVMANLIARYPDSAVPHRIAAEFAQSTHRYEDARNHWLAAAKIEPRSINAPVGLARLAIEEGRPEEAVSTLKPFYSVDSPNLALATQLVRGLQQTGQLDQAAQVAHQALEAFPKDRFLLETAAEIDSQRGELESAVRLCEQGLSVDPSSGSLHVILSNVYRRLGKPDLADKHLKISREVRPQVTTGGGEFELKYDRSVRSLVSHTIACAADFFADRGEAVQAEQLALRAAEIHPQGADAYRVLSKVCYHENRFEDAYRVHRRLVEVEPGNPLNYVSLSKLAFLTGDADAGHDALLTAHQRMPESSIVSTALAACYLEDGDLAKARQIAEESVRINPSLQAYQVLSAACAGLGDRDGQRIAEHAIQKLMKSTPSAEPATR